MDSQVILCGTVIFLACLSAHVLTWRLKRPQRDALALFAIFLIIPMLFLTFLFVLWPGQFFLTQVEVIAALLLHASVSSAYIATYPAAQASSPSLDIVMMIAAARGGRMSGEELGKRFDDSRLVQDRVNDLKAGRLLTEKEGLFIITPAARLMIIVFIGYRKILGLPMGKG